MVLIAVGAVIAQILALIWLGRDIALMAIARGRNPAGYVMMLIVMCACGEALGIILGSSIDVSGAWEQFNLAIYLCAAAGAIVGIVVAFLVTRSVSNLTPGGGRRAHAADVVGAPVAPVPPPVVPPPPPPAALPPRTRRPGT